jgi:hypothetical protein
VRRQDAAKYAGEKYFEFSCCYEHYGLSVRQEESAGMERHLLRRRFQVFPHGFMVRLVGHTYHT